MTRQEQIELIDYMIKREPDSTIKDFIEMRNEFIEIRKTENESIKTIPTTGKGRYIQGI